MKTHVRVLVEHADAGTGSTRGPLDEWRGLSPAGHTQARELAARLGEWPLRVALSSPSLRCRQTVVPLARHLGVDVEPCRWLAADADPARVVRLLADDETRDAVLCLDPATLGAVIAGLDYPGLCCVARLPPWDGIAAWLMHELPGRNVPAVDDLGLALEAQRGQRRGVQSQEPAVRRGQTDPPRGRDPQRVPVSDQGHVAVDQQGPDPGEHPVEPLTDLGGGLAVGASICPQ
jgi:hypothetical protein